MRAENYRVDRVIEDRSLADWEDRKWRRTWERSSGRNAATRSLLISEGTSVRRYYEGR